MEKGKESDDEIENNEMNNFSRNHNMLEANKIGFSQVFEAIAAGEYMGGRSGAHTPSFNNNFHKITRNVCIHLPCYAEL